MSILEAGLGGHDLESLWLHFANKFDFLLVNFRTLFHRCVKFLFSKIN